MNYVDLSDQLHNVYLVFPWMRKYTWWYYLLGEGNGLLLVNYYNIYKTLCEEVKVNPISHYEFQHQVCLTNIDPKVIGGRNNLVSAVQR